MKMKNVNIITRYSNTDKPDEHGRWARLILYKNLHIAWINRVEIDNTVMFTINTHFPINSNDMPCYIGKELTYNDAKNKVLELWNDFISKI